jgi:chromate reductase, NAD(P)H dehydrogenase (quinone)
MIRLLVFLGSARDSAPPKPPRLGERVARAMTAQITEAGFDVELIDPLDYDFPAVFKPHFSYAKGQAPEWLETLAGKINAADGYVVVSSEYNHSMNPALTHLMNHFGGSLYGFKPSAIVTYSAGQWGGARAAMNLRPYLSELGCLPVSAMIHIPKAQDVFNEEGGYLEGVDGDRWRGYFARALSQLDWWARAAKTHKAEADPTEVSPVFDKDPSQRNAP